jgi:hypothetical protein
MSIKVEVTSIESLIELAVQFFEMNNCGQEEIATAAIKSTATGCVETLFFQEHAIDPLKEDVEFMDQQELSDAKSIEEMLDKGANVSFYSNFLGFHWICFQDLEDEDSGFVTEPQFIELVKRIGKDLEIRLGNQDSPAIHKRGV